MSIDIFKRRGDGALEIIMKSISLVGGVLWFIGSVFMYSTTFMLRVWCVMWILGSIMNLVSITFDIFMIFRRSSSTKPLFRTISLGLSWIANVLMWGGTAHILTEFNSLSICDLSNAAGVLISAGVIFLIHSIFHTLAIFKGKVLFSIRSA